MIHVGTTPVCLKRQEKNSRVHTLELGVLPPTGATANLLVRGAHSQRLHLKRSGTRRSAAFHVGRTPVCSKGRAWCAGNQCCCRHGGRYDGRWRRRCGASTGRAPHRGHRVIPTYYHITRDNRGDILGYPDLSHIEGYPGISRDIPGFPDLVFIP